LIRNLDDALYKPISLSAWAIGCRCRILHCGQAPAATHEPAASKDEEPLMTHGDAPGPARRMLIDPPPGTDVLTSAPGRANLIGEYTDVNEGFVLPVALELRTVVAGRRGGRRLVVSSKELAGEPPVVVDVDTGDGPERGWGRYATAVVRTLRQAGLAMDGVEGLVSSDVPLGAGLSSSAALEVALALALLREAVDPLPLARLCQRAENEGVGVQSGLMDQFASTGARQGTALLLDCRDDAAEHVPIDPGLVVLVIDSGVPRELSASAYNDRRQECARAAHALGAPSLREVDVATLERVWDDLDDVARRRARHVVTENARVLATARALRTGDDDAVGAAMTASHDSLAGDFEVSTPELDLLVALTRQQPGVVGSRLTGAGFGGCSVSLVRRERAEPVLAAVLAAYAERSGHRPRGWISRPAGGATRSR